MARERLRLMPRLVTTDTALAPSASSMWRSSATRSPSRTPARSPGPCARLLWTPPMSRSVRTPSPPSAPRPTPRSTTALPLLVMTPRLSPEVTAMEVTTARGPLSLATEVTPPAPSARSTWRGSATRCPRHTRGRCPDRCATLSPGSSATPPPTGSPGRSAPMSTARSTDMDTTKSVHHVPHTMNISSYKYDQYYLPNKDKVKLELSDRS